MGIYNETWRRRSRGMLCAVGALALFAGCDQLLEVELPGDVLEEDLNSSALAATLVRGVESDFDCAFGNYVFTLGMWVADLNIATGSRGNYEVVTRSPDWFRSANGPCTGNLNVLLPLHTSRVQGANAAKLVAEFPTKDVTDPDFLIGKAYAYEGYSTQLLSEAYCAVTFDAGPLQTRAQGFERAINRFTLALEHARRVTSGPNAAEAQSIVNMALVGRARANLHLGKSAAVVADAREVPMAFVRNATYSDADTRRYNKVFDQVNRSRGYPVHASYLGLTVAGKPDPRVGVVHYGKGTGFDGVTDMWGQLKYTSLSAAMPFATGREAQLMIAEVQGGQTAVQIINALRATHGLAPFSSTDPTAIRDQVREERRRELWLQGTRLGDLLRWGVKLPQGVNQRGDPYNPLYDCVPLEGAEEQSNPNL